MLYPQLLVYETDGLLAASLRPLAEERRWALREPRQLGACLRLLRRPHPAVLVLKIGADVIREMSLLERVRWLRPEAATVVVGDVENGALALLAWHFGAGYVLVPPQPRFLLPAVIVSLMEHSVSRLRPAAGRSTVGPGAAEPLGESLPEQEV